MKKEELLTKANSKTMKVSELQALLKKYNGKTIELRGTLSLPDAGNFIILSTEKQW